MTMKTSDVLNKAADLIGQRGWKSGSGWTEKDGGLCLEGAIWSALGESIAEPPPWWLLEACPVAQAVRSYLDLASETSTPWCDYSRPTEDWLLPGARLFIWNDHPHRTAEQVIETLRAAAVIEAAKESADDREQVSA